MKGDSLSLMERILSLLCALQEHHLEIEELMEPERAASLSADSDTLRMALELVQFMDEMPGGFLIYRADGGEELIYANRELLRIFQCDSMEELRALTGDSFQGLVYPEDLDMVEKSIREQIAGSQYDLDDVEYRIRRKDGAVRFVEDYGHFVHSKAVGDFFYVFLRDATDKENQRRLERERMMADMAVNAKNTFLSNISHDMRTPLNAIFGYITLARMCMDDRESLQEYLDQVELAGKKLLTMITEVLEVSELTGAAGPAEEECDLLEIAGGVYEFLLPQAQEKGIDFRLDSGSVRHRGIYADGERLRQLVMSLANNAITYTEAGGRVSVTVTEGEELPDCHVLFRIAVEDTGIGISEEFLEKIFEPFSREKNSTLSGVHGIGLGLTIAKGIVDMMGGTIDAKSTQGQGTVFTVNLALRVQPMLDGSAKERTAQQVRQRLLLVEDNEINREIATDLLENMGFWIDPAENGQVAVDKMRRAAPGDYDVVIMDLQMPVLDGWQASAAIRRLPDPTLAHIPIIALSANIMASDRQKSKESGINVHLTKPLDLPVLLDTIEELTGKRPPAKG